MTQIPLENNAVVLRNGKVGTEQACCCGSCECPTSCSPGLEISIGGEPECLDGFGSVLYRDFIPGPFAGCDGNHAVLGWSVEMWCVDGVWSVSVFGCGQNCNIRKTATLEIGDDCLPTAGVVDSSLFVDQSLQNPACCPQPPEVSVIR